MKSNKKICWIIPVFIWAGSIPHITPVVSALAEENQQQEDKHKKIKELEEIVVSADSGTQGILLSPTDTEIKTEQFSSVGDVGTVDEILKHRSVVDFRAESDLVPDDDSITLRGFSNNRFVTAVDGLTVQKTGGRKSSHIVDFALLPTFLVDIIEVLPGPHSALYDAKSIGGVLNMVTKRPKKRDTLKPDISLSTGFRSYNTQRHNLSLEGAVESFTYDFAYQKNSSDGYLRNYQSDIDTVFTRFGYLLPDDGLITLSGSYTWADRTIPVKNPGTALDGSEDYDSSYPVYEGASFNPWENPSWNKEAYSLRLHGDKATPIGMLSLNAYTGKEDRDRAYYVKKGQDIVWTPWVTEWWQQGGKLQDKFIWNSRHTSIFGADMVQMYDNGIVASEKSERINKKGFYAQHQWAILPSLNLRLGARYEDVTICVENGSGDFRHIPGLPLEIERNWSELIPKSFLTWKMDKKTSLSAGISKIWHAPDYHGDYNPQGRPTGDWLEPEHGMGYDLVFMRRLWRDIAFKANYSFYSIENYMAYNRTFAKYGSSKAGALAYSDYKINLEEMQRHGIELELDGHLTDDLSFYLTYAWQNFDNQGNEPAGEQVQEGQAENRLTLGLRYDLFEKTTLLLDYYYQGAEVTEVAEEVQPDTWVFHEVENPSYSVFDLGVQQTLLKDAYRMKDVKLNVYVKNLLDEEYYETKGTPSTDRTFGATLSMRF
ncbi:MAG: TonB-dependent receptor [Candidatus Electrothrix sp. AW2]|nr:TonB-dependent receptor [Candidatus Electrothrix gigas]